MSGAVTPIRVDALADARLDDYRHVKEAHLRASGDAFIAESELVVRKLLESRLTVRSLLLTEPRWRALSDGRSPLRPDVPVYLVEQSLMDAVAGFHVHRGCLAIGVRPADAQVPTGARTIVVLEDLVDVDNLGAMVRNAAAFGAEAVVLSPRCADPFYRKAIRVSMGNVFAVPIVRLARWPDDLIALRELHGFAIVGAVVDARATPIRRFMPPDRVALLLGSEGPGLTPQARAACDALVTIPMANADSLNVATAGAVLLHELSAVARSSP